MNSESAKHLIVRTIPARMGRAFVCSHHYSGSCNNNAQIFFGVFWRGALEGVMALGPPMDRRKSILLVRDTAWNGLIELLRMAFSEALPRNSESRALSVALRMLRKSAPHIEWIQSFADATQCGDGTIYRAAGFVLTGIRRNRTLALQDDGSVRAKTSMCRDPLVLQQTKGASRVVGTMLPGFQVRYMYFQNPEARKRLTVQELPYSAIVDAGASMYRGVSRAGSSISRTVGDQPDDGGSNPTTALQN